MRGPKDHPHRHRLSNEVHARPSFPIETPSKISYIAMLSDKAQRQADYDALCALLDAFQHITPPSYEARHFSSDLGPFSIVWERHTEFVRYTFIIRGESDAFAHPVIDLLPKDWLSRLPGDLIVGVNAALSQSDTAIDVKQVIAETLLEPPVVGALISRGEASVATDFRIHADGFTRLCIRNHKMDTWSTGRIVQRLLEIETYRMMATQSLPVAQDLLAKLVTWETELSHIAEGMVELKTQDQTRPLERLMTLQAAIEKISAQSQFRFSAGAAYYSLVKARILELNESELPQAQMFGEFTERRLAPAMATCMSTERRLSALSARVDRVTQLLSTHVNLLLEQQNQGLLESMDRRVGLQIRLQQTVEGLSAAAISYYLIGIVAYIVKAVEEAGLAINTALTIGISAPIILALVSGSIWRIRKHFTDSDHPSQAKH
mgnify:CR=1 FL=1